MQAILDKTCPVLLIHFNESARIGMRSLMTKNGFKDVATSDKLADAESFLKADGKGWIFMPITLGRSNGQDLGAMAFLKRLCKDVKLVGYRCTFFVEEEDYHHLPQAFAYGLLSFITMPFSPHKFSEDISLLLNLALKDKDPLSIAAYFLRQHIAKAKDWQNSLRLEGSLLRLDPENPQPYLFLAKAHFAMQNEAKAKTYFKKAILKDKKVEEEVQDFLLNSGPLGLKLRKELQFKSCLLVDSDSDVHAMIIEVLTNDFGLAKEDIYIKTDGESAYEFCEKEFSPDLIIMEWKLKKLGGGKLVQRLQDLFQSDKEREQIPIIIASSLIEKKDSFLLSEMFVSGTIEKPLRRDDLILLIKNVLLESLFPSEAKSLEREILFALGRKDLAAAGELKNKFAALKNIPLGKMEYIEAEFSFALKRFKDARAMAVLAIKLAGKEDLASLNLLGKCLLNLNDLKGAIRCFEKAKSISPDNLKRLCDLSDAHTDLGDHQKAEKNLEAAKNYDTKSPAVKRSEVKLKVAQGDSESARNLMSELSNRKEMLAQMNNRAVAYIRSNDFQQGKKIYEQALLAIPEDDKSLKGKILYNLGLAHGKKGDLKAAKACLEEKDLQLDKDLVKKAKSLLKKVDNSIKTNKPLSLNLSEAEIFTSQEEAADILGAQEDGKYLGEDGEILELPKPTGFCLYKVFKNSA